MNVTQQSHPPSVEQFLNMDGIATLQERYGRSSLLKVVRDYLAELREAYRLNELPPKTLLKECLAAEVTTRLESSHTPNVRRMFNLTGTVLHTNQLN